MHTAASWWLSPAKRGHRGRRTRWQAQSGTRAFHVQPRPRQNANDPRAVFSRTDQNPVTTRAGGREPREIAAHRPNRAVRPLLACAPSWAQTDIAPQVLQQMAAIAKVKASFTPAQRKMSSNLVFGVMAEAGDARVAPFTSVIPPLAGASKIPVAAGNVVVEIKGDVNAALIGAITAAKGSVIYQSPRWGAVTASLADDRARGHSGACRRAAGAAHPRGGRPTRVR